MTPNDPSIICRIEGRIVQSVYKEILERELIHTMYVYNINPTSLIFQRNNDPKHTSKSMRRRLNSQEFTLSKWSTYSLDLNPIKHL